ncbi:MAG: sugar ABC transporter permease [Aeromicrobium sp.]
MTSRFRVARLVVPAIAILLAVTAWPLGRAIYLSLYNDPYTNPGARRFVGFDNYQNVLTNGGWWQSIFGALAVVVLVVAAQLLIGFAFARVLTNLVRLAPIARILVILPFAAMSFLSAFSWRAAFNGGFLNDWFRFDELGDRGALLTICLSEIWRGTGIVAVILYVGMTRIRPSLMEAAVADGAKPLQRLTRVILPALGPAAAAAVAYRVLDSLRMFDAPFAVARQGSDLNPPQTWIFDTTLSRFEFGLGATMSVTFLLLSGIFGAALVWILRIRRAV